MEKKVSTQENKDQENRKSGKKKSTVEDSFKFSENMITIKLIIANEHFEFNL